MLISCIYEEASVVRRESIDASILKEMFVAGANRLDANKDMVNDLNVFPVPDGDTGTNMSLTILAAAKEVEKVTQDSIHEVAKAASSGSLRGARGNSGVILSQIVRGFYKGLEHATTADVVMLANAMKQGADTAYKAVMKPKEGTILTVAREMATKAMELSLENNDIVEVLQGVVKHGREILDQTPEMLSVLKDAGVVDAGGEGLMCIIEGGLTVLTGQENVPTVSIKDEEKPVIEGHVHSYNIEDIIYGYCTEFIVKLKKDSQFDETEMKKYLSAIGDSIVVVSDEQYIKVHIHTDNPGKALEKALTIGPLTDIKIDNMRDQHAALSKQEEQNKPKEKIPLAFISIAAGSGMIEIMSTLGVTEVIKGGQTMNPSTDDIFNAIEKCHAEQIVILPNNKNILLAAEQAAKLVTDTKVYVLPTKTIPQGISAMIAHNPSLDIDEMLEEMKEAVSEVKTGQITHAIRDTKIEGKTIKEGNFLGLFDDDISVIGEELDETAKELIENMIDEDSEIISIYYGAEVGPEDAQALEEYLEDTYPDCDVEVHSGDQPVYYYIISVE